MKSIQKLILPGLFIVVIVIIYLFYFSPKGLGSFSTFDVNNTAVKEIVVEYVKDKGIENNAQGGTAIFYAKDKSGTVVMVQGPLPLPNGFENAKTITLKGHLEKEFFHAHEVVVN